jgi:23S rRNA pseudouridine1911/1915/1917 synthase
MAVLPDGGRLAITHWQVLEPIHQQFSHMQLVLDTGRTHQIRVHMAYVRHPILGDPLYGSGVDKAIGLKLGRQLLQAFSLSLIHPVTDAPVEVSIPTDPLIESTLTELRSRWESVRS